jgi:hypothetical protein
MISPKAYQKRHAKARQRRRHTAQERLERDRRQAQHAAQVLEQALHDVGLPANLVAEIKGRLRSQQRLLGKIVGLMCPPLFGCRTNTELCRVRVAYPLAADNVSGPLPIRLRRVHQPVISPPNVFSRTL